MPPAFIHPSDFPAVERSNEHGGAGPILFRRLLDGGDFRAPVDFVDFTIVPPGTVIGAHHHHGNEEMYFVLSGTPLVCVDGRRKRLERGSIATVGSGSWHELINDTDSDVEILVIQVRI